MQRSMTAALIALLVVAGCASMKAPSPSPEAAIGAPAPGVPAPSAPAPGVPAPSAPAPEAAPSPLPESSAKSGPDSATGNGTDQSAGAKAPAATLPPAEAGSPASSAKTKSPAEGRQAKQAAAPAARPASAPTPTSIKPRVETLNLADLEQRLRDTHAIGVFTKLSLKNQVDDLLAEFRTLYQGPNKHPPSELRQRYDQLLLKVLGLLQSGDPQLAAAVASSREAIWSILADPEKFSKI